MIALPQTKLQVNLREPNWDSGNFAAIDVGSNAIRMIVSHLEGDGSLKTLESLRLPIRLGQDAFSTGQFTEKTMRMAVDAFILFRKVADFFGVKRVRALATSAMRESANSDLLVERIARQTSFDVEIISGEDEARFVHLAVSKALDLKGRRSVLIDIGGGSVEVAISDGENIVSSESYGMGTVRLLQKLEANGEKSLPFNRLIREYAESARHHIDREIGVEKLELCVGTGGNIEEMGKLRARLFKRDREDVITRDELDILVEKLSSMSVAERIKKFGLRPDRADVILPATVVLRMIARETGVKVVSIPHVGLKDGILLDMLSQTIGPKLPRRAQALASAVHMGRKFTYNAEHAAFTAKQSVNLFNQSLSLHHLSENESLLLEISAMLHDIGHFIGTIDHERHGYYLIHHHSLIGLDADEQEIVANVVRYHRKEMPSIADENFKHLNQRERLTVLKLLSLLRLADAMDVGYTGRVEDAILEKYSDGIWQLKLCGDGDFMLERWALEKRKTLFQDIFGIKLNIV